MRTTFTLNGAAHTADAPDETLLTEYLRDTLGLTGTHIGCDTSQCGACNVLVDGESAKACTLLVATLEGARVTTIEGLSDARDHPVQTAWLEQQVPQCGFCQSGMIMAAAALLKANPNPSRADIRAAISNICRCGTYPRVEAAILRAAEIARGS